MLMQYTPVNTDVLPIFVLLVGFPALLWLLNCAPRITLAGSFLLYSGGHRLGLNPPAWPRGQWYFNPLAWQLLFVLRSWYAMPDADRLRAIVQSNAVMVRALLYDNPLRRQLPSDLLSKRAPRVHRSRCAETNFKWVCDASSCQLHRDRADDRRSDSHDLDGEDRPARTQAFLIAAYSPGRGRWCSGPPKRQALILVKGGQSHASNMALSATLLGCCSVPPLPKELKQEIINACPSDHDPGSPYGDTRDDHARSGEQDAVAACQRTPSG
jgi:hypothetical protein